MRFLLIPVADAMPAVEAYLERWPDNGSPPSPQELRELVELTYRFVAVSEALLAYANTLAGPPSRN